MRTITLCATLALAACGGKGTDLEGIYTVDTWNENPTSCADPGPLVTTNDPMLFVKLESLFGQDFLAVVGCADTPTCAAEANDDEVDLFATFLLDQGSDGDGWTGKTGAYSSMPDPVTGQCDGLAILSTLTVDGDTAFQVRSEHIDVAAFPPRGPDCEADDLYAAAETAPCTRLEVVHATFTADL